MLKWARENGCPWDVDTSANAALGGHLEVLKWLRSNGCPWSEGTWEAAAQGGHLEMLKWLRESGCPWSEGTWEAAARSGHLEILKLALDGLLEDDDDELTSEHSSEWESFDGDLEEDSE